MIIGKIKGTQPIFALNYMEGMRAELKTVLVSLSPIIFIMSSLTILSIFLILPCIIFSTEFIITKREKILFFELVVK